jgi:hypothetical protein
MMKLSAAFVVLACVLGAAQLSAQFVTVTVQISPAGAGTVTDNFGISYPGPAISYNNGSTITFTANPGTGNTFASWSGTPPVSTANPRALNLTPWNGQSITLIANFNVPAAAPTVTTPTSANVTGTTATLGGNVTSDGGQTVTARGVVFALTAVNPNPQIGGTGVTNITGTGTTGVFTVNVGSLSVASGYTYRAYATNSVGTGYTSNATFTTDSAPTVTSPTATSITNNSATLGGTVTSDGGGAITQRGVVYALTAVNPNPQLGGTGVTSVAGAGTTGAFTVGATGLANNSAYTYRAFATNPVGTSYSATSTFTTLDPPGISQHPQSQSIGTGQTATLTVTATGNPAPDYQWYQGTAPSTTSPVGTNSSSYTTPPLGGTVSYWVRVSNSVGSVDSNTAVISIQSPPQVSIGAPSASVTRNGPVTFTITYTNATAVTLATTDVGLNTTGTAAGTVAVSGGGTATRTVSVQNITGEGSMSITIGFGTASNAAGQASGVGPSSVFTVDGTAPVLVPGATISIPQGGVSTGAAIGSVTDDVSASGNVLVAATGVPTGLIVSNLTNTGGTVTADIGALSATAAGAYQIEFTVTDEAGNSSTANLAVDVTANVAPTITAVVDQSIAMNANTGALTFDVDDADEGPSALIVTVDASNQVLVDLLTDVLLGGTGLNRTVTITPQADHVGVTLITLTVTDSVGASTSTSFTLTVTDTTDAPDLTGLVDLTITRDATSGPFNFTATDPQGDGTLNAPQAISSDQLLVADASIVITGTAPNFSFTITPEAGVTGDVLLTFWVDDGTHTSSRTISVSIVDPTPSAGGGGDDDDEDCSTSEGCSGLWLVLALAGLAAVSVRNRRRAA